MTNKPNYAYLVLFISSFLLLIGCEMKSAIKNDTKELETYLKTKNIKVLEDGNILTVSISNSKLIKENSLKKGTKWSTYEAYASIAALITASNLRDDNFIDSVVINIKNGSVSESYGYAVEDLQKVRNYVDVGRDFLKEWSNKKFTNAYSLLDSNIQAKFTRIDDIKVALSPILSSGSLNKSQLIAFKINEGLAGLYINGYYNDGTATTYIFTFKLTGPSKIAGIELPN